MPNQKSTQETATHRSPYNAFYIGTTDNCGVYRQLMPRTSLHIYQLTGCTFCMHLCSSNATSAPISQERITMQHHGQIILELSNASPRRSNTQQFTKVSL